MTHSCGHEQVHPLKGRVWQREKDAAFQATRPCTACWRLERASEAESLCWVANLPALKGSEAQVGWARSLRAEQLNRLKAQAGSLDKLLAGWGLPPTAQPFLDLAVAFALEEKRAKWWIDERDELDAMRLFLPLKELHEFQAQLEQNQPCPF